MTLPDPAYWLRKAEDFRRAALRTARNEEAAILARRAQEFARMAGLIAAEYGLVSALPEPAGRNMGVPGVLRQMAGAQRREPAPSGNFVTTMAATPTEPKPHVRIARRARRLAFPPANDAAPRMVIARRARRLAFPPANDAAPRLVIARRAQRLAR